MYRKKRAHTYRREVAYSTNLTVLNLGLDAPTVRAEPSADLSNLVR